MIYKYDAHPYILQQQNFAAAALSSYIVTAVTSDIQQHNGKFSLGTVKQLFGHMNQCKQMTA